MTAGTIKTFRDLIAWQRGVDLVCSVYEVTRSMPDTERFELSRQMRRAAISIPSNIAEGYGRQSTKDYIKYLRIARGSLAELMTQVELSVRLQLIPRNQELDHLLTEEDRVLQGLIRSLERKLPKRR